MYNLTDYNNYPIRKFTRETLTMRPKKGPSIEVLNEDFPTPTLPKIHGELKQ